MTNEELEEARKVAAACDDACAERVRIWMGTNSEDWWAKRLGHTPPREELRMWQNAYREVYLLGDENGNSTARRKTAID